MPSDELRINVIYRDEVDVAKAARALLDLVNSLDADERDALAIEGAELLDGRDLKQSATGKAGDPTA